MFFIFFTNILSLIIAYNTSGVFSIIFGVSILSLFLTSFLFICHLGGIDYTSIFFSIITVIYSSYGLNTMDLSIGNYKINIYNGDTISDEKELLPLDFKMESDNPNTNTNSNSNSNTNTNPNPNTNTNTNTNPNSNTNTNPNPNQDRFPNPYNNSPDFGSDIQWPSERNTPTYVARSSDDEDEVVSPCVPIPPADVALELEMDKVKEQQKELMEEYQNLENDRAESKNRKRSAEDADLDDEIEKIIEKKRVKREVEIHEQLGNLFEKEEKIQRETKELLGKNYEIQHPNDNPQASTSAPTTSTDAAASAPSPTFWEKLWPTESKIVKVSDIPSSSPEAEPEPDTGKNKRKIKKEK